MHKAYTILAKYYDLIFQGKDYKKEASFIQHIVKSLNPNAKSILDVGCGTGTHLNLLKNNFKQFYGVDLNSEIIEIAKKKSDKIKYFTGRMEDF